MLPHGETVTRLRAAAVADPYSGETNELNWSSTTSLTIEGVAVAPGGSTEPLEVGSDRTDTDLTLYVPYQVDVGPLDRMVVRGETYTVEGNRIDWRNPYTGSEPGSELRLRRVVG
jgi:hypothetical protein